MSMMRARLVAIAACFALGGLVAGCVIWPASPPPDLPPPVAAAQCYWLSNQGEGWVERTDVTGPDICYELDSCSGGLGMSRGGCYKWANGPDAPAIPWRDLGL